MTIFGFGFRDLRRRVSKIGQNWSIPETRRRRPLVKSRDKKHLFKGFCLDFWSNLTKFAKLGKFTPLRDPNWAKTPYSVVLELDSRDLVLGSCCKEVLGQFNPLRAKLVQRVLLRPLGVLEVTLGPSSDLFELSGAKS